MRALSQRRRIRHGEASLPQGGHEGRAVRRVPHAGAELHGRGPAARSQHPRAASRPVRCRSAARIACTQCHADRKPEWAAAAMDQWYGKTWRERRHYGTTLHAGATQGAKALPALLALAEDRDGAAHREGDRGDAGRSPSPAAKPAGGAQAACELRSRRAHRRARPDRAVRAGRPRAGGRAAARRPGPRRARRGRTRSRRRR